MSDETKDPEQATAPTNSLGVSGGSGATGCSNPAMNSTPWQPPSPEQARRERIEYFAQQIYITAAQTGQPRDAVQCAKDAKALYTELDKVDGGEE